MRKHPVSIFLPAAGLGERLRPVTNHMPKPLLPILGTPLIEGILEKLTAVCDGAIGINLHYKGDMIRAWAATTPWAERIRFFPEEPILGTGGALKNAGALLSGGPFIVHNSDILLDIDFSRLIEQHLSSGNIATLVCHRLPALSNVVIDKIGQVLDVENPGASKPDLSTIAEKTAYTGIAVYAPEILAFLPAGVSHATVAWIAASQAGRKVRAVDVTGAPWNDVGNPATYAQGVLDALRSAGESVYFSKTAIVENMDFNGYVIVESDAVIQPGAHLRNCIVMPDARVQGRHRDAILGPDYEITLTEADMQPSLHAAEKKRVSLSDPIFASHFGVKATEEHTSEIPDSRFRGNDDVHSALRTPNSSRRAPNSQPRTPHSELWSDAILIGLGGSDRKYFRVRKDDRTAVLMECRPDDQDYERHLAYTGFFAEHGVPVPKLYAADKPAKRALFEDLGDTSLYSFLKLHRSAEHIGEIYRRVLDIAVRLHRDATGHIDRCPLLGGRIFDYAYLRWETGYFLERFVLGHRKMKITNQQALDEELSHLARETDAFPKGVIHRDFQCQNIVITNSVPRVIDFQGARMAPPAYDIASILWDPYYRLDDGLREGLLDYYVGEMKKKNPRFDENRFIESLLPCRLQRHMQALGAYGFLSDAKGKKYFEKHIPEALRLLRQETAAVKNDYPDLVRLVRKLA